jgi:hypothetical protein
MRTRAQSLALAALLVAVLAVPVSSVVGTGPQVSAVTCRAGSSACPIRITFAPGAYSAQATGSLASQSVDTWFVVRARANQSAIVIVEGAGPTRGIVYFPNHRYSGMPGGRVFDGLLSVTGDYRIRVSESTMAQPWHGPVTVLVVAY